MKTARFLTRAVPLVLVLVALVAVPAFARHGHRGPGPGHPPGGPGPGMFFGMMGDELNLTDEQRTRIHELMLQQYETNADLRDRLRDARRAMADLVHADQVDEVAIRAAAADVASAEADMMISHAELLQQIRPLLDAEQVTKMQEIFEKHRELRGQGPGGFFGQGPHGPGDCRCLDDDSGSGK